MWGWGRGATHDRHAHAHTHKGIGGSSKLHNMLPLSCKLLALSQRRPVGSIMVQKNHISLYEYKYGHPTNTTEKQHSVNVTPKEIQNQMKIQTTVWNSTNITSKRATSLVYLVWNESHAPHYCAFIFADEFQWVIFVIQTYHCFSLVHLTNGTVLCVHILWHMVGINDAYEGHLWHP